mmetsp:Transcript_8774/g.19894  ORF Transcript_8774/g.19894 Transcript_8774/m.19894 type:complete len:104 (+) Transcript_8774:704-1015(+)
MYRFDFFARAAFAHFNAVPPQRRTNGLVFTPDRYSVLHAPEKRVRHLGCGALHHGLKSGRIEKHSGLALGVRGKVIVPVRIFDEPDCAKMDYHIEDWGGASVP